MNFNKLIWLIKKYVKLIPKGQRITTNCGYDKHWKPSAGNEIMLWFWAKILITEKTLAMRENG